MPYHNFLSKKVLEKLFELDEEYLMNMNCDIRNCFCEGSNRQPDMLKIDNRIRNIYRDGYKQAIKDTKKILKKLNNYEKEL